jgi:hypothetical protein
MQRLRHLRHLLSLVLPAFERTGFRSRLQSPCLWVRLLCSRSARWSSLLRKLALLRSVWPPGGVLALKQHSPSETARYLTTALPQHLEGWRCTSQSRIAIVRMACPSARAPSQLLSLCHHNSFFNQVCAYQEQLEEESTRSGLLNLCSHAPEVRAPGKTEFRAQPFTIEVGPPSTSFSIFLNFPSPTYTCPSTLSHPNPLLTPARTPVRLSS